MNTAQTFTQSVLSRFHSGRILQRQDDIRLHLKNRLLNSEVLEYLDLTPEEMLELRQSGVSIREYAESNGYSVDHLKKLMEKSMVNRLEVLKAEGVIAESDYQERLEDLYERIERRLDASSRTHTPGKMAALVRASAW